MSSAESSAQLIYFHLNSVSTVSALVHLTDEVQPSRVVNALEANMEEVFRPYLGSPLSSIGCRERAYETLSPSV